MVNKKISQLEEKTDLLLDDEFPFIRKQGNNYINYKVKKDKLSPIIPNATSDVSGIIKLTGDLGGTSVNPTVPGLNLKANINSPNFTGNPTAVTPSLLDNSTKLATTAFVNNFVPIASSSSAGKVKIGSGIPITSDGTISSFKHTNRIYVNKQGADSNDGRSPSTALSTIKAAARLAASTSQIESIYVESGEYLEDNPIYLPPGTAVIGDNLRRTILKPLNEGRDFFWWSSGCYVNYLVFQDYYFGGYGLLDTSSQSVERELSSTALNLKVFSGHTLQRLPGVYKDASGLITFQRQSIINNSYSQMLTQNPGLGILGGGEITCKRDIGYIVDAVASDLKAGGNVNSIKAGIAYRDQNGDLISTIVNEVNQTKQAFNAARTLCKSAIMTVPSGYPTTVDTTNPGACTQVSDTIDNLFDLIISLIDGGDVPEYNSGVSYLLIDQEWIEILDIQENDITIADSGKRGINNPINGENTDATKHINGAVISQGGRAFRYAVAFPDQDGFWGKGRIAISGLNVTGTNTKFTKELFVGWFLQVGANKYKITAINSDTSITIDSTATLTGKAYKIIPKKEQIFLSPYIQNCSNISVLGKAVYNSEIQEYEASKTRAGGMLIDNAQLDIKSPVPSNVADAFTQIAFGAIGFHHKNDGYAQLVSVFQVFNGAGVLCESGGYSSVTNSATNFGKLGLVSIGYSKKAIPSFANGSIVSVENVTKAIFNNTPSSIVSSSLVNQNNKIKAVINVNINDISKFEAGQTISIANHTSTPSITGSYSISKVNFTDNTIEINTNINAPSTIVNGEATGAITITSGKLETVVTASGFLENPLVNYVVKIFEGNTQIQLPSNGIDFIVNEVIQRLEGNLCKFTLQNVIEWNTTQLATLANKKIELRSPSTVNSSGHTFEFVGAGTNYTALPINGGRTDKNKQTVEINAGKCYVSGTDQDGNFTVGNYFNVDLRTGKVTFTGKVSLGVLDQLELLNSPGVPVNKFVTTIRPQNSTENNALATEKAVYNFVATNLGSLFNKQPTTSGGTSSSQNQLVMLNQEGIVDPSMIRIPAVNTYTVNSQQERLVNSINGVNLKVGDYVLQLNPTPATKYLLTALPATTAANWSLASTESFDASAIVSGLISTPRLGGGIANNTTFLNGANTWQPVVTQLQSSTNSPILVGAANNTTPVLNGQAGSLEIDIQKVAYSTGQSSGSSSLGVASFTFADFAINSNTVSIKDKLRSVVTPLSFDAGSGILSIPEANSTQSGFLSSAKWSDFENKLNRNSNLSDLQNVQTAKTNLGLNNVDNTSDINKPISTATQTAINSLNNTALAYSIALG